MKKSNYTPEQVVFTLKQHESGETVASIMVQLLRKSADTPGPTHFRVANGKVGVSVVQTDGVKVLAGAMEGNLELTKPRDAANFLEGGKPASPVALDAVEAKTAAELVEVVLPKIITEGNPEVLTCEWCNGDKVR